MAIFLSALKAALGIGAVCGTWATLAIVRRRGDPPPPRDADTGATPSSYKCGSGCHGCPGRDPGGPAQEIHPIDQP